MILCTKVVVLGLKLELAAKDPDSLNGKIFVFEELLRPENSRTCV